MQETDALRDFDPAFDRFGSFATEAGEASTRARPLRPESRRTALGPGRPLCANRVLMHRSKQQPYSITSGGGKQRS